MRRFLDFSSWSGLLTTLLGLVVVTLVAVGIRLLFMQTLQRRRERENRQINERLKTLIAAYKTLGGSFTGDLTVDPLHLGEQRRRAATMPDAIDPDSSVAERRRRTRDAVEAALSDVILLGTEEQVLMATQVANDMVAGRNVETAALVASLRDFIRQALDLEPIPAGLAIPNQGPLRVVTGGGSGGKRGDGERGGADGGGGMGGMAVGAGAGAGAGLSLGRNPADPPDP